MTLSLHTESATQSHAGWTQCAALEATLAEKDAPLRAPADETSAAPAAKEDLEAQLGQDNGGPRGNGSRTGGEGRAIFRLRAEKDEQKWRVFGGRPVAGFISKSF